MARKTKTTAKNSGPKGPVVVEETVEDAVELTDGDAAIDTPKTTLTDDGLSAEAIEEPWDHTDDANPVAAEPSPDAEQAGSNSSDDDDTDPPAEAVAKVVEEIVEPIPKPPAPIPSPQVTVQKVGFVPLVLGGAIAAVLGFGAAWYYFGQQGAILSDRIAEQSSRIADLETQIAAIPSDTIDLSPIEAGLAQTTESVTTLSAQVDELQGGIGSDIAAIDERLTAVERAPGADGTLAETAIASWEQELDGLRSEIAAQQGRLQEIATNAQADLDATKIAAQEVEQSAVEAAEQAVARAALARVQVALDSGTPFDAALADLTGTGTEAPAALSDVAPGGVTTITDLKDAFPAAARAALAAARSSGEADVDSNPLTAFLRNQFDVRSVAPREGGDPDAILSRAGAALAENRLTDALAEIESLPEVSRVEMSDWIGNAEARTAAMAAVETLDQSMNN